MWYDLRVVSYDRGKMARFVCRNKVPAATHTMRWPVKFIPPKIHAEKLVYENSKKDWNS